MRSAPLGVTTTGHRCPRCPAGLGSPPPDTADPTRWLPPDDTPVRPTNRYARRHRDRQLAGVPEVVADARAAPHQEELALYAEDEGYRCGDVCDT